MFLRRTAKAAIGGRKRAALAPLEVKGKDKMDASRVVERHEGETTPSRSPNDTAKRVRTEKGTVAEVLVDHFAMGTEEELRVAHVRGRTGVASGRRAKRKVSDLKVAVRRLRSRSTSTSGSDTLWASFIGEAAEEKDAAAIVQCFLKQDEQEKLQEVLSYFFVAECSKFVDSALVGTQAVPR